MDEPRFSRRAFLALPALGAAAGAEPSPPNIVFILADDLGYGDVSCLNPQSKIQTPNLDRFAREGVVFTDAHSPSSVCTPTRYGILTGRYCWRGKLERGVLQGGSPALIEPGRLTVAAMLKRQGYATACTGKWHLGLDWAVKDGKPVEAAMENVDFGKPFGRGPTTLGFDYYFGISASLDMPPYTYLENDRAVEIPAETTSGEPFPRNWRPGPKAQGFRHGEVLSRITEKAAAWIDRWAARRSGQPFFLYMPLTAPHTPVLPREQFLNRTGAGAYGAFVAEVDGSVQQVLDAIRRAGAERSTLVVLTSDNGPERQMEERKREFQHYSAAHYRGHKRHLWDGGHRVPFLARWPERIRPGGRCADLACLTDFFATAAAAAGASVPREAGEDSYNLLPALTGAKPPRPIREAVVHHSASGAFAIRQRNWKLILLKGAGDGAPSKDPGEPAGQLYDLAADPGETANLYGKRPELVARLTALLEKYKLEGRSAS